MKERNTVGDTIWEGNPSKLIFTKRELKQLRSQMRHLLVFNSRTAKFKRHKNRSREGGSKSTDKMSISLHREASYKWYQSQMITCLLPHIFQ